jgi:hypothetical protein
MFYIEILVYFIIIICNCNILCSRIFIRCLFWIFVIWCNEYDIFIILLMKVHVKRKKRICHIRVFGSALASAFFVKFNNIMFGYLQQLCFGHGTHKNLMFHRRFCASNFFMLLAAFLLSEELHSSLFT